MGKQHGRNDGERSFCFGASTQHHFVAATHEIKLHRTLGENARQMLVGRPTLEPQVGAIRAVQLVFLPNHTNQPLFLGVHPNVQLQDIGYK